MIGVFDSGVGGLTVLKHIHAKLPKYSTMYLGDSAHSPFGNKTHKQITEYTWEGVKFLFESGCPLVILACNSASAQALRIIQQTKLIAEYSDNRVLGVIRPTVEELAKKYRHIGVLATPATVKSKAYIHEFNKINPELEISQHACLEWVTIVEQNRALLDESRGIISRDLKALLKDQPSIEAVLLGCTHYPALYDQIRAELPDNIDLFEQGPLVAKSLEDYLSRHPEIEESLDKTGKRQYFITGDAGMAQKAAVQIAGMNNSFVRVDLTDRTG